MVKTFGERLAFARKHVNLSQTDVARLTGMTQPSIAALEKGKSKRSHRIMELSTALGQSAEWLAYGTGPFHEGVRPPPRTEAFTIKEGPVVIELRITITVDKPPARSRAPERSGRQEDERQAGDG